MTPLNILIGRLQRTVVVTVHGELDRPSAAHLSLVLADLIDGQGNLSVVVDLHDATAADSDRLTVLAEAAERARRRGGAMTLSEPPAPLHEALRNLGLDQLVGILNQSGRNAGTTRERSQSNPAEASAR